MRTLILIVVLAVMNGCSTNAEVPAETVATEEPVEEERLTDSIGGGDWYGWLGQATLEEMVVASPIIVRGRLASVTPVGVRSRLSLNGTIPGAMNLEGYQGSLEFTFDVLEYLKGSGGDQVTGVAYGLVRSRIDTPAAAAEEARPLLDARDKRWDDREAIVFLRKPPTHGNDHLADQLDHHWLGYLDVHSQSNVKITVASGEGKAWLPDASPPGDTTRSSSEQQFLLEDPRNSGASGARAATAKTDSDSISLAALKARITTIEASLTAGGVSDAYRDCVVTTYQWNRVPVDDRLIETTIASGLPAETIVHTFEDAAEITLSLFGPTKPAVGAGEHWLEGPDSHLFGYKYPGHQYLLRPLPAGEYRYFNMFRLDEMVLCDGDPHALRGKRAHVVTVTAGEGTLAEAFFDPARDGAALSETTTIGTVKWEAGTVEAMLTLDVTGHKLDFIALNGTVILSLDAADATDTGSVLSWPVAPQPWEAGDKLMLRVHQLPPPAPSGLTARVGSRSVTLNWQAPDDDSVTGYQILRRRPQIGEDTFLVYVKSTGSTSTTFTDRALTGGIRHLYRVKAINAAGLSEWSNSVRIVPYARSGD